MVTVRRTRVILAALAAILAAGSSSAGTFAATVMDYDPGVGSAPGYDDPWTATGSATRVTGFDLRVTPFNPPFQPTEIVSIGRGGWLTLAFDAPVHDNPANPFGIDLLIFGSSFFYASDFSPVAEDLWRPGGVVEVSADNADWRVVPGAVASGLFPTRGFRDSLDPFGSDGGSLPTDFHMPVDPSFSPWGKTFDELSSGYGASGGGAGIDIAVTGLPWVKFIRLSNPGDAPYAIGIDAVSSVVPSPALALAFVVGLSALGGRRR
ncbi:MAG: hypothetical protein KF787_09770 [Phycisphaeraceae bacterium]|nr:hypothetical protein [Phycisphaerae bacterium]MBX3392920.1 hypothetical protein [Phycisphaeraceae bacterium]